MAEDRYAALRELPFEVVAKALDIDFGKFKSRKGGAEHAGPCPVHRPKKNSTSFSYCQDGRWNCFSCSAKGKGAIDLVKAVRGVGFEAAVGILEPFTGSGAAQMAAAQARKPEIKQVQEIPTENPPFDGASYSKYAVPSEWPQKRGIEPRTLERFGVFQYDNPARRSAYKGKILIPVRRFKDGELVAYLARNPNLAEGEPKYVWPKEFRKSLEVFGSWELKEDHKLPLRIVYLVESPFAVMKFWQMGLPAVSTFGYSVSVGQARILAELAKGVVYLPDQDKRGEALAQAGAVALHLWCRMPNFAKADPEELTPDEIRALT